MGHDLLELLLVGRPGTGEAEAIDIDIDREIRRERIKKLEFMILCSELFFWVLGNDKKMEN